MLLCVLLSTFQPCAQSAVNCTAFTTAKLLQALGECFSLAYYVSHPVNQSARQPATCELTFIHVSAMSQN
jgi:hypothetical protein